MKKCLKSTILWVFSYKKIFKTTQNLWAEANQPSQIEYKLKWNLIRIK